MRRIFTLFALVWYWSFAAAHATSAAGNPGKIGDEVLVRLAHAPRATVVVLFEAPAPGTADRAVRTRRIATTADAILSALPADDFTQRHRFRHVAALALDVGPKAIEVLRADPRVVQVDLDVGGTAHMNQAAPLARVSEVRALGYTGQGIKVGILDSGLRATHLDLADSLVDEHCFCSSDTAGEGCCPNGADQQSGPGSAADGWGHGTNVAGIITGNGAHAPMGGAPATSVVMVRMLSDEGRFRTSADITASLDWLADNHPDVRVVNMSVGTGRLFASSCDTTTSWSAAAYQAAQVLALNGTVLTASAGNQGNPTSVSMPACLSNVLGIGAVWDSSMSDQEFLDCIDTDISADLPTCFSNSGDNIALYAPGAYTTSTDQHSDTGASFWGGTSQAAPLVAACVADLLQLRPMATPAQIGAALAATPTHVTDPKNQRSFPRLDCMASALALDTIFRNGLD